MPRSVFYSFHYDRDVHRVQLVRNIGALEGQPLLNAQQWEDVKGQGRAAVEKWIDDEMKYKRAVIVLIGKETASREFVQYEIDRAWELKKPLLGVYIHGLSSMGVADSKGQDPFRSASLTSVPTFDPTVTDLRGRIDTQATYANLRRNLPGWSERGAVRK